ncbi:hypothetical protein MKY88_24130 [Lysinibacillus sp. FSL R7-0073]|uniref:Uncharacterized protein n=1 Tax=Lysinibacillus fusiformis TaxID=28031 RepID=A0A1E4QYM9_9BACI|nr:hypothetical protein [Lysinibacillus fusiformis]MBD8523973.1 hypothetical protein [Lysinibacillus fusiformis]MED4888948.1 hypothetical protein [Lysinibacillus fusiformis]ODV53279.1 hypothetical protein BG258_23545 [Lysinibacillus fusiformis]WKT77194.1 hypothetical protein QYY55_24955 [Lysinibacillus fusiformis]
MKKIIKDLLKDENKILGLTSHSFMVLSLIILFYSFTKKEFFEVLNSSGFIFVLQLIIFVTVQVSITKSN